MMLTEEEARKKWCPFGRTPHYARDHDLSGVVAANRAQQTFDQYVADIPARPVPTCACIASECMSWRWAEKDREKCFHSHGPAPDPEVWERVSPADAIGVWPTYRRRSPRGYCGLAGSPE